MSWGYYHCCTLEMWDMDMVPHAQMINTELPQHFLIATEPEWVRNKCLSTRVIFGEGGIGIGLYSVESILLTDLFWDMLPK